MRTSMKKGLARGGAVGVILLSLVSLGALAEQRRDVARMASAADAFLSSLSAEQRARASYDFEDEERLRFHFIPNEMFERRGVMLADMSETQRERAHDLLRAGLSQRGYMTATEVMELEDVLLALEGGQRFARDKDEYLFSVFGEPGPGATWGWRFEGHHISLHFTIIDGSIGVSSPAFVGANPAEVLSGPKEGLRVLADREDRARALVRALDALQRIDATIDTEAPRDILTGAELDIDPLQPVGISAATMSAPQRDLLLELIESYARMMSRGRRRPPAPPAPRGRHRRDHLRVGWRIRCRPAALLPRAGADLPHRVRQHAERREPHPFRMA